MLLEKATFTVFDFETTGLYPYRGDKICEIGAARVEPAKKEQKKFHSMVNPERPISRGAFLVNGITEDMLIGAPRIQEILPAFMRFIEGSILVAYNAGFDIGFLECSLGSDKDALNDYCVIDALKLARRLFTGIDSYNLASVARALGMRPLREHRAISDVSMTLEIFQKELDILSAHGARTIKDVEKTWPKRVALVKRVKDYKTKLIEEAIRDEKRLNITYISSWRNEITNRTITPKEIQNGYDRSYVIAYCHLRNAERNFRLDGIIDIKPEKSNQK